MPLFLKNPHAVLAVLQTRPQDIFEIRLPSERPGGAWDKVQALAREIDVKVVAGKAALQGDRRRPPRDRKGSAGRTGAAEAQVKERVGVPVEDLFPGVSEGAGERGLWLALDTVQDPQNLGAIFRTAAFFGLRGIVITRDRSAPLSAAVYDVASGGVEYVPFSIQTNLSRALDFAKERGLWVLGTSEDAETDLGQVASDRPWLLVLGNEERGMRRLTREKCDAICRISPQGNVTSLNVSVAAGIFMRELSD